MTSASCSSGASPLRSRAVENLKDSTREADGVLEQPSRSDAEPDERSFERLRVKPQLVRISP